MSLNKLVILNLFVLGGLFLSHNLNAAESPVVATVGSKTITLEEFNKRYDEVKKRALNPPPKKDFLEDLVRYEIGIQEAEKRDLAHDPLIAERLREQLYTGLVEKDLAPKISAINVSEGEMKDFYKNNPEVRTAHIEIQVKTNATPAERVIAKKRAEEILADVRKAAKRPFPELVKLYSDDLATKDHGGDTGYQTRLTVFPSYYEASIKLKTNQISDVVETPFSFHIIKLLGVHSFADANKRQIRSAVFEKKKIAIFNEYFDKLKKHYKISVNEDTIR
jgi:parvulin-like peptidyl-prolyl isomerase